MEFIYFRLAELVTSCLLVLLLLKHNCDLKERMEVVEFGGDLLAGWRILIHRLTSLSSREGRPPRAAPGQGLLKAEMFHPMRGAAGAEPARLRLLQRQQAHRPRRSPPPPHLRRPPPVYIPLQR